MEKINLTLDPEQYPKITGAYSLDELKETLVKLCKLHYGKDAEITEARLYSVAGMLESDLQHDLS